MKEENIESEQFTDRVIFMPMYNDIVWRNKKSLCIANSASVSNYAKRFPQGHWSFLGPGTQEKWYGSHTYKPDGKLNQVAEQMILNFRESGPLYSEEQVRWTEELNEVESCQYTIAEIQTRQS